MNISLHFASSTVVLFGVVVFLELSGLVFLARFYWRRKHPKYLADTSWPKVPRE